MDGAEAAPADADQRDTATASHPGTRTRVLLVDDTIDVLVLFRTTLGFEKDVEVVGEAKDGADAIEAAEALQPDCVVIDWQMPVLDGPSAIPGLRKVAPAAKIILFSNRFGPGAEAAASAAGADVFLEKQGDLTALLGAIRLVCRGQSAT